MRRWHYSSFLLSMPWSSSCTHFNNYMTPTNTTSRNSTNSIVCVCVSVCVRACVRVRTCACDFCCTFAIVQINVNILIGEMTFHCEKYNLHIIVVVSALSNGNSEALYLWSISFNFQSFSIPAVLKQMPLCVHKLLKDFDFDWNWVCVPLRLWPLLNTLRDNEISINWPNVVRNWSKYGKLTHSHSN